MQQAMHEQQDEMDTCCSFEDDFSGLNQSPVPRPANPLTRIAHGGEWFNEQCIKREAQVRVYKIDVLGLLGEITNRIFFRQREQISAASICRNVEKGPVVPHQM
jgi:hypothetical protein